MPFKFKTEGSFQSIESYLKRVTTKGIHATLSRHGSAGVAALSSVTPTDTGLSSSSWSYKVTKKGRGWELSWHNQNRISNGTPLVILLHYGHGTGTGGYVAGQDFINPAIQPVFDQIVTDLRREVAFK